nr:unnamed protein product [Callosobruchus chinensis]
MEWTKFAVLNDSYFNVVRPSCKRLAQLLGQRSACAMFPIWQPFNISDSMIFLAQFTSMLFVLLASGIMMSIYIEVAESLSIADCIFECGWHRGTVSEQMTIQFMIARSQKPIIVRAVPFGVYNYALFLASLSIENKWRSEGKLSQSNPVFQDKGR